jgi:hypothetical protein
MSEEHNSHKQFEQLCIAHHASLMQRRTSLKLTSQGWPQLRMNCCEQHSTSTSSAWSSWLQQPLLLLPALLRLLGPCQPATMAVMIPCSSLALRTPKSLQQGNCHAHGIVFQGSALRQTHTQELSSICSDCKTVKLA